MIPPPRDPKSVAVSGYTVLSELGRGGMGVVYRAREEASGREVALKLLLGGGLGAEHAERLRREAQVTASLQHPGIVRVHGAGDENGVPFIVYELVEGARSFADVRGELGLTARCALVRDTARALGHAHAAGVMHRDVKPENLLVDGEGRVRVMDFGLASAVGLERLTRTGALVGTPLYMAPEQVGGRRDAFGPATDVWALGVVLYECLTDALPFEGHTLIELMAQIGAARPESPRRVNPDLPVALEAVCLKALSAKPGDRYESGAEFADALDAALAGRDEGKRGKTSIVIGLGALAVVGLVAVGAVVSPDSADSRSSAGSGADAADAADATDGAGGPDGADGVDGVDGPEPAGLDGPESAADAPEWYLGLRRAERPALPLPAGWTFGERPREYVHDGPNRTVMVWVPAGTLVLGGGFEGRVADLRRGFFLGKTEVTRGEYRRFCEETGRDMPSLTIEPYNDAPDDDTLPVFNVGFEDIVAYCEWAGLRLPTYVEWELAARGPTGRTYPWGETPPRPDLAAFNYSRGAPLRPLPVGSLPKGRAPCGALDMVGNVYEVVSGLPVGRPVPLDALADAGQPPDGMEARGGSYHTGSQNNRTGWSSKRVDRNGSAKTGFRVAGPKAED